MSFIRSNSFHPSDYLSIQIFCHAILNLKFCIISNHLKDSFLPFPHCLPVNRLTNRVNAELEIKKDVGTIVQGSEYIRIVGGVEITLENRIVKDSDEVGHIHQVEHNVLHKKPVLSFKVDVIIS